MKEDLVGNQEDKEPQYIYYPNGEKKAQLIHLLGRGDCPSCWEKQKHVFTDGIKVYKRIV